MNKYYFVSSSCNPIDFGEIRWLKIRKDFSLWSHLIHKHGTLKPCQWLFRNLRTVRYKVASYFILRLFFIMIIITLSTLLVFSPRNIENSHCVWHTFSNHRTVAGRSLCKNSTLKTRTENVGKNYKEKRTRHTRWTRIVPETNGLFKSS